MTFWEFDLGFGDFILDLTFISMLLVLGSIGRWKIPFFQNYLIPSSLIAGFLGLILGPELLRILNFQTERMGLYLYHLLAILFICIGLQHTSKHKSRGAVHVGLMFVVSYLLQLIVGLSCMLLLAYFFIPTLSPAIGMLLPLGYGMGPGLAYNLGYSWELDYGIIGAGSIGLTISAIGFLIAYFSGMTIVNRGIRKKKTVLLSDKQHLSTSIRTGIVREKPLPSAGNLVFHGSSIEPLSFQLGLIGFLYLLTYLATFGLDKLMQMGGLDQYVSILWSFHFLIANFIALLTVRILRSLQVDHLLDTGLSQRLTGVFTDYLITAAIMAISLSVAWSFAGPILLMCISGALVTGFALYFLSYRSFDDYPFERFTGIFGEMTGTLASGLALVRVTDPEFKTPIALDLGLGSGFALVAGFPLFVIINIPFVYFDGERAGYWAVIGICIVYLLVIWLIWKRIRLRSYKR